MIQDHPQTYTHRSGKRQQLEQILAANHICSRFNWIVYTWKLENVIKVPPISFCFPLSLRNRIHSGVLSSPLNPLHTCTFWQNVHLASITCLLGAKRNFFPKQSVVQTDIQTAVVASHPEFNTRVGGDIRSVFQFYISHRLMHALTSFHAPCSLAAHVSCLNETDLACRSISDLRCQRHQRHDLSLSSALLPCGISSHFHISSRPLSFLNLSLAVVADKEWNTNVGPDILSYSTLAVASLQHQQYRPNKLMFYCPSLLQLCNRVQTGPVVVRPAAVELLWYHSVLYKLCVFLGWSVCMRMCACSEKKV